MFLLRFDEVSLKLGDKKLLNEVSFQIDTKERVCLLGRNGAGKSTILKLIQKEIEVDSGEIHTMKNIKISGLAQKVMPNSEIGVGEFLKLGLSDYVSKVDELNKLTQSSANSKQIAILQEQIDMYGIWDIEHLVDSTATRLNLPLNKKISELSGGWKRRVSLAQTIISQPDLLLLDEPTNHLDIDTINWLEKEIRQFNGSILFVTHDRTFLQKIATRIIDVDRGKVTSWPGTYQQFLEKKEQSELIEDKQWQLFDKKLAVEEQWIRKGVKARTKRNQGRVRALQELRQQKGEQIKRQAKVAFTASKGEESSNKVIEMHNVSYQVGDEKLIDSFNLKIMKGDRIGILGNNGVGKTTILKLILKELEPNSGWVKHGLHLNVSYFDQESKKLDEDKSLMENISGKSDFIEMNNKTMHSIGYLKKFLFTPEQAMAKVKNLSGGERNRLLLARLLAQKNNFIILDEPTNDLDVEMLEALEDLLWEYQGTVIIVSHDRAFLDNVVTSILAFEEDTIREYVGSYSDWLSKGTTLKVVDNQNKDQSNNPEKKQNNKTKKKKLSYKLATELEELPNDIDKLELELLDLNTSMGQLDFQKLPASEKKETLKKNTDLQRQLKKTILRFEELMEQSEQT